MNLHNYFGRVLIIAAHADDETLGCGGLITKLKSHKIDCHIHVVTGYGSSHHPLFEKGQIDQIRNEFVKAISHLGSPEYSFGELPAAMVNEVPMYIINKKIKEVIEINRPNTILMPSQNDLHLDHKIINYAVKVAARPYLKINKNLDKLIEYEVPSETNMYVDQVSEVFNPNFFININSEIDSKLEAFSEYKSQLQLDFQPRTLEVLKSLAIYRGSNIGVRFAEAYKILINKVPD